MNPFNLLKKHYIINEKKYIVENKIGEGAFADIYHVKGSNKEDKSKDFAIKKMKIQSIEQLHESQKEIKILYKINHRNVIPLLGSDIIKSKKDYDVVILLLPLYFSNVQQIIDSGKGYPYCSFIDGLDVVRVLRDCSEGLAAIHASGYRHNDLKPANILLTGENMRAVITDFGSASELVTVVASRLDALAIQDEASRSTTAPYRAPELFDTPSSCLINGKSDIWSFGCVMYNILFSKTPFENQVEGLSTLAVMSSKYILPEGHCWPVDYTNIIDECLKLVLDARIDIDQLIIKLKKLSSPPPSLSFTVIEKKHDIAAILPSSLPPKHKGKIHSNNNDNSNGNNNSNSNDSTIFTADFADFEKFQSSDGSNNHNNNNNNNNDNNDTSFGNFISSSNNDTNDDEFGEFESSQPTIDKDGDKYTDSNTNTTNSNPTKLTSIDADILVKQIISESTVNIIKSGTTYILRPSGIFKKIVRKSVFLILTTSGLLVKKSDSKTAKVHHLLTFSQLLSVTSTDTSSIGLNGLLIDGYCPTIFMRKNKDNIDNDDSNYTDYIVDDDYDEDNIKSEKSNNDNDSIFTKCRITISFDTKDTLIEWMDAIEYQHQQYFHSL